MTYLFDFNIIFLNTIFFLDPLYVTPITKVVTELKDQIVCAQIANDEKMWDNLTYSPVEGDEVFEEIYD